MHPRFLEILRLALIPTLRTQQPTYLPPPPHDLVLIILNNSCLSLSLLSHLQGSLLSPVTFSLRSSTSEKRHKLLLTISSGHLLHKILDAALWRHRAHFCCALLSLGSTKGATPRDRGSILAQPNLKHLIPSQAPLPETSTACSVTSVSW